jgi:hypothetical protein
MDGLGFKEVIERLRQNGHISDYESIFILERMRDIGRDIGRCDLGMLFNDFYLLSGKVDRILRDLKYRNEESNFRQLRGALDELISDITKALRSNCGCREGRY